MESLPSETSTMQLGNPLILHVADAGNSVQGSNRAGGMLGLPSRTRALAWRCVFHEQLHSQIGDQTGNRLAQPEMVAWRAIVRVLRSPLDAVSCAAFPCHCRLCNEPLLHLCQAPVCAACWRNLQEQSAHNLCAICGEHLGWGGLRFSSRPAAGARSLCDLCERARPPFQQATAYGVYEDTLRMLIHLLKYERVAPVAQPLGALLARAVLRLDNLPEAVTVVPVPLHAAKQRERGFNQTILLAEAAMRQLRRSRTQASFTLAARALGRPRRTDSQSGLTPHQRRLNLRGAFSVADRTRIEGRTILLVDDIYTTGATARECTRTLLGAGAASVHVATLARSQREGVAFWDSATARDVAAVGEVETETAKQGSALL